MLTRRSFAGVASCALCAITSFAATDASAQTTSPATTPGVTRKILSQTDGPVPGYVTINVEAEIEPGVTVARHTHPLGRLRDTDRSQMIDLLCPPRIEIAQRVIT